jgi:hypothetical protein
MNGKKLRPICSQSFHSKSVFLVSGFSAFSVFFSFLASLVFLVFLVFLFVKVFEGGKRFPPIAFLLTVTDDA